MGARGVVATQMQVTSALLRRQNLRLLHFIALTIVCLTATDYLLAAQTPVDSVMSTLDDLVRSGKVLYIGASNFSGWQLMKSQAAADRYGYAKYVAHQVYYSLIGRDYEWELMPLGLDQGIGAVVWSPLGWGRLTGRVRRDRPTPTRRLKETSQFAPPVDDTRLHRVIDALDEVAAETGKNIPQIALNWVLQRPAVATVLIGARNEEQLRDNLGAID